MGAVQRHLAAAGHRLSAPAVASLLADLGFAVGSKRVHTRDYDFKIEAEVQYPEKAGRARAEVSLLRRDRAAGAQPAVPRLLAKLEELERQLAAVSVSQDRLDAAWEAGDVTREAAAGGGGHRWGAKAAAPSPQSRLLGSEAQQLHDWAQGRWPAVAAAPPDDRGRRARSKPPSRRTDPVARYRYERCILTIRFADSSLFKVLPAAAGMPLTAPSRHAPRQLQRVWARDPFLRSGGDCRTSRRRGEGFRDAFAALHSGGSEA